MPSPLYHGTASLYIHEQKGDFPQRKVQAGSTSVPVLSPCSNAQVAGSTVDISSSSAASPAQLTWAHLLQLPAASSLHSHLPLVTTALLSLYLLHFLLFSIFPLETLSETKVPASLSQSTLLFLKKFPLGAQEGIAITRQPPLLIYYLLLSPMFNQSVQHKMSPGSVLEQNFNPSPVLRYNFHGQQPFSSSERRNEKHRKSLPMKASSSSASTCPPWPRKAFFTQWKPKFLSQNSEDKCFRKAWSTCCRQHTGRENEAPNWK